MPKKTFIINGDNFSNLDEFYNEIEDKLTDNFKDFGRNFNAFNDILRGGFGKFEYEEPIKIIWKNSDKSKKDFSKFISNKYNSLFNVILDIILSNKHIELKLK